MSNTRNWCRFDAYYSVSCTVPLFGHPSVEPSLSRPLELPDPGGSIPATKVAISLAGLFLTTLLDHRTDGSQFGRPDTDNSERKETHENYHALRLTHDSLARDWGLQCFAAATATAATAAAAAATATAAAATPICPLRREVRHLPRSHNPHKSVVDWFCVLTDYYTILDPLNPWKGKFYAVQNVHHLISGPFNCEVFGREAAPGSLKLLAWLPCLPNGEKE